MAVLRLQRKLIKLSTNDQVEYLTDLYKQNVNEIITPKIAIKEDPEMVIEETETTLKKLKNRKSAGQDYITNKLLRNGDETLNQELTK